MAERGFLNLNIPKQLGFHYYADQEHYDAESLEYWLPKIKSGNARWLVLPIPIDFDIPEDFIQMLTANKIEPVIQLNMFLSKALPEILFQQKMNYYQTLGIHMVQFFNQPNMRSSWLPEEWQKSGLVGRFVQLFAQYAQICISERIIPLFPLLKPGGDYWDTSFLKDSLQELVRNYSTTILPNLIYTASAGLQEHPLTWGKGGPSAHPGQKAYVDNVDDHRGFHIFEWYHAILQQELKKNVPLMLFDAGEWTSGTGPFDISPREAKQQYLQILRSLQQPLEDKTISDVVVPSYVLACNMYKLPSSSLITIGEEPQEEESKLKKIFSIPKQALEQKSALSEVLRLVSAALVVILPFLSTRLVPFVQTVFANMIRIIKTLLYAIQNYRSVKEYFLIPEISQMFTEDQYEVIRQYVKMKKCRSGHSVDDAINASKVLMLNDERLYSTDELSRLKEKKPNIQTISLQIQNR